MLFRSEGYEADTRRLDPHLEARRAASGVAREEAAIQSTREFIMSRTDPVSRAALTSPMPTSSDVPDWTIRTATRIQQFAQLFPDAPTEILMAAAATDMTASDVRELWDDVRTAKAKAKKDAEDDDRWDGGWWSDLGGAIQSGKETGFRWLKQGSRFGTEAMMAPMDAANLALRGVAAGLAAGESALTGGNPRFTQGWKSDFSLGGLDDSIGIIGLIQNPDEAGQGYTAQGQVAERKINAQLQQFHFQNGPFKHRGFTVGRALTGSSMGGFAPWEAWSDGAPGLLRNTINMVPGVETDEEWTAKLMSGLIDVRVAMKYDPGIVAFKQGARFVRGMTRAERTFRATNNLEREAGLVRGAFRDWIHGPTRDKWVMSTAADDLVETLADATDIRTVEKAFGGQGDIEIWRNFAHLTDPTDVREELRLVLDADIARAPKKIDIRKARTYEQRVAAARDEFGNIPIADFGLKARAVRNVKLEALRFNKRMPVKIVPHDDPTALYRSVEDMFDTVKMPYSMRNETLNMFKDWHSPADTYRIWKHSLETVLSSLMSRNGFLPGSDYEKAMRSYMRMFDKTIDDAGIYALDALGKPVADAKVVLGGVPSAFGDIPMAVPVGKGPLWANQFLNSSIIMPDARVLRQQSSVLRSVVGRVKWKELGIEGEFGAVNWLDKPTHFLDHYVYHPWKAMNLWRMGGVTRNVGEAQAAMAANGAVSLLNHPIEYMSLIVAAKKGTLTAAMEDFTGQGWQKIMDDMSISHAYKDAMPMSSRRARKLRQMQRDTHFTAVARNSEQYADAWMRELVRFGTNEPVVRRLAQALLSEDVDGAIKAVKDDFWDGGLQNFRKMLMRDPPDPDTELDIHHFLHTRVGADAYIDNVYIQKRLNVIAPDPELLEVIASQRFGGFDLNMLYKVDKSGTKWRRTKVGRTITEKSRVAGSAGGAGVFRGRSLLRDRLEELKNLDMGPELMRYQRALKDPTAKEGGAGAAADWMWDMLYAEPSARLSVHPGWVQAYTKDVAKLAPHMTEESIVRAKKYLPAKVYDAIDWDAVMSSRGTKDARLTIEDVDKIATRRATDWAKDTFYDVVNNQKLHFWDILRFLAPFGEAWQDALVRWGRYLRKNPYLYGRAAEAIDDGQSSGFITEDQDGNLLINIPGGKWLTSTAQKVGVPGFAPGVDNPVPMPLTMPVRGLNMIAQSMPGVGPLVTVPAAYLLPEEHTPDLVKEILFPFGEPDVDNGVLEALLPGYAQRIRAAFSPTNSAQQEQALGTLATNILAYYGTAGVYDLGDPDQRAEAIQSAKKAAKTVYLVRGATQFFAPSPPQAESVVKLSNGHLANLYVMVEEYRRMEQDDPENALGDFLTKYGENMWLLVQPTTFQTRYGVAPTAEFGRWKDKNQSVYERYRNVAALFGPGYELSAKGFDRDEYRRQMAEGDRESMVPDNRTMQIDDWLALAQNRVGEWQYQNYIRQVDALHPNMDSEERAWRIRNVRVAIGKDFPGWRNEQVLGQLRKVEVPRGIEDLQRMSNDPDAATMPGMESLRDYLSARENLLDALVREGMVTIDGGGNREVPSTKASLWYRMELSRYAEMLSVGDPYFGRVWHEFLSYEGNMDKLYEEIVDTADDGLDGE